ncbi:hypothetical protein [Acinetobacter sp. CIP 102136]|uniref:hypothetical protein n=1 Tax=Acinetobacter sp. CIP 102136 TaxID=1144665 RepID=UPI0002CEB11A|nr:hypothetical protein [Acinetobacter sp. CIP 102136]ENX18767.1 hypothetical protein F893_03166 [Acinetobacter sp. CIP 102136]
MSLFINLKKLGVNTTVLATSISLVACGGGGSDGYYNNGSPSGNTGEGNTSDNNQSETDTSKVANSLSISLQDIEGKPLQIAQDNSQVKIAVKVLNIDKGGIAGKDVRLSIGGEDLGVESTNSKVSSDENGVALFTLNIPALQTDTGKVQLTAKVEGTTVSIPYTLNIKKTSTIISDYNLNVPQGLVLNLPKGSTDVVLQVTDAKSGAKVGQTVELTLPPEMNGKFIVETGSSVTTDTQGKATFKISANPNLTSDDIANFVESSQKLSFKLIDEYRAEKNAVTSLTFKDISSVVNKLEIITPEDSIAAKDGTAKILVFAKNSAGNVLKNTQVKLAVDAIAKYYGVQLDKNEATTNSEGYAEFTLKSNSNYPIALSQRGIELTATYENNPDINGKATVQVVTADSSVNNQEAIQRLEIASAYKVNAVNDSVEIKVKAINYKGLGASKGNITLSLNAGATSNGVTFDGAATRDVDPNGFVTFKLKTISLTPTPTQKAIDALIDAGIEATFTADNGASNKINIIVDNEIVSEKTIDYLQIDPILNTFDYKKDQTITVKVKALDEKGSPLIGEKLQLNKNTQFQSLGLSLNGNAEAATRDDGYAIFELDYKYNGSEPQRIAAEQGVNIVFSAVRDSKKTQSIKLNFATQAKPELDYLTVDTDGIKSIILGVEKIVTVRVAAVDKNGDALANQLVNLNVKDNISLTKGVSYASPTEVTTDSNGLAVFSLKVKAQNQSDYDALMNGFDIEVTPIGSDTKKISRHIELSAFTTDPEANSKVAQLMIDPITNAFSYVQNQNIVIRAKALDDKGNPLVNARVNIESSLSSTDMKALQLSLVSQAEQVTDAEGYATFIYSYKYDGTSTQANLAKAGVEFTIRSAITNKVDNIAIKFATLPKVLDYFNVSLSQYALALEGGEKVISITVDAKDINGDILAGQQVSIGLNDAALPNGIKLLTPSSLITDNAGKAVFQISIDPKTAEQIANLDANDLTIAILGKRPDGSSYSAVQKVELSKPVEVLPDLANLLFTTIDDKPLDTISVLGGETRVKVKAVDENGKPIPNTPIAIALSSLTSSRVSLSNIPTQTNSEGKAEFTVTVAEGEYDPSLIKNGIIFAVVGTNLNNGDRLQQTGAINITAPANALNPRLTSDVKTVTAGQTIKVYAAVKDEMGVNTVTGTPMRLSLNKEAIDAGVKLKANGVDIEGVLIPADSSIEFALEVPKGITTDILQSIRVTGVIRDPKGNEIPAILTFTVEDVENPNHLEINSFKNTLNPGDDRTVVVVRLLDASNNPVRNEEVTLAVRKTNTTTGKNVGFITEENTSDENNHPLPENIAEKWTVKTDEDGRGFFTLYIPKEGFDKDALIASGITLDATNTTNGIDVKQVLHLNVTDPTSTTPRHNIFIKPDQSTINVVDGTATVSVSLRDQFGGAVSNEYITLNLKNSNFNGAYIQGASGIVTNNNGEAKFIIKIDESLRRNYTETAFINEDLELSASFSGATQTHILDVVRKSVNNLVINITDNHLEPVANGNAYEQTLKATVKDELGNLVKEQNVSFEIKPQSYIRGQNLWALAPTNSITPPTSEMKWVFAGQRYYQGDNAANPELVNQSLHCNFAVDVTQVTNANVALDVVKFKASNDATWTGVTNNSGEINFVITYPKTYAQWLNVRIDATAESNSYRMSNSYPHLLRNQQGNDKNFNGIYSINAISPFGTNTSECTP